MSALYEDFEREMAAWRVRYAGRPRAEMVRLFLLALEREELVSVGYRETAIVARLRTMPLEPEARDLIRHALLWAWKDEEMHAVYIRGALFQFGGPLLKARALAHQAAGGVAGWATALRQHVPWAQAPLARLLATLVSGSGWLAGKVPGHVWKHLQYRPFRHFCLFNVDAEKTAWLCWDRLVELAASQPDLAPDLVADFRRVVADEERHGRVFAILADALGEDDRLVPGETPKSLARKIGEVGECFLPRSLRLAASCANPLGGGGRVLVACGAAAAEKRPLFRRLLDDAGLPDFLAGRARDLGKRVQDLAVAVKPSFMMGYHRRDRSALTDPELLDELARYLREAGCRDVAVVEGPTIYDRFFANRGVREVADYFGISSPHYRLVDLGREQVRHDYFRGMGQYTVGKSWKDADFRILFGKVRSHPVEMVFLNVGNAEWLGGRCEQFLFPERQTRRETSVMMLLDEFPPHLALLDAYDAAADGLAGVMGCPRPPAPRRLYAGRDALAVDRVAARHLGLKDADASSLLRAARHWFGDPAVPVEVVGRDEPLAGWRGPYRTNWTTFLSFLALPAYVFASGRGALFVPEMDEAAFPPLRPVGRLLRLGRRGVQTLLGLRLPKP